MNITFKGKLHWTLIKEKKRIFFSRPLHLERAICHCGEQNAGI